MLGNIKKDVTVGHVPNDWRIMSNKHSTSYDLKRTNPNYHNSIQYQCNCQRCVPAYEMRRRGYDVEALPAALGSNNKIHRWDIMRDKWDEVFENAKFESCKNDLEDVKKYMKACGNGARAEVKVIWQNGLDGHVFVAEQIKGKTLFF